MPLWGRYISLMFHFFTAIPIKHACTIPNNKLCNREARLELHIVLFLKTLQMPLLKSCLRTALLETWKVMLW